MEIERLRPRGHEYLLVMLRECMGLPDVLLRLILEFLVEYKLFTYILRTPFRTSNVLYNFKRTYFIQKVYDIDYIYYKLEEMWKEEVEIFYQHDNRGCECPIKSKVVGDLYFLTRGGFYPHCSPECKYLICFSKISESFLRRNAVCQFDCIDFIPDVLEALKFEGDNYSYDMPNIDHDGSGYFIWQDKFFIYDKML